MSSEQKNKTGDEPIAKKTATDSPANNKDTVVELKQTAKSKPETRDLNKRFADLELQITDINQQLDSRKEELKKIRTTNTSTKSQLNKKIKDTVTHLKGLDDNYATLQNTLQESVVRLTDDAAAIRSEADQTNTSQAELINGIQAKAEQLNGQIQTLEKRIEESHKENTKALNDLNKELKSSNTAHTAAIGVVQTNLNQQHSETESAITRQADSIEELRKADQQISEASVQRDTKLQEELTSANQTHESSINKVQANLDYQSAELNANIQQADKKIRQHEGRLEQHRVADEVLQARATILENNTGKLGEQTIKLENVANKLGQQSEQLLTAVSGLNHKTEELQTTTETQGAQISNLSDRETGHFKLLGTGILALALLGVGGYVYEKGLWQADNLHNQALQTQLLDQKSALSENAQQQQLLQQQLADLQQQLIDSKQQTSTDIQQSIASIQSMEEEKVALQGEVEALQDRLKGMTDGVETLDGRLVAMNPNRQFGGDNTVHGSHWLAKQDPQAYTIELARLTKKQDLYKTAQRYSYYLKEKLAWYSIGSGANTRYVLVYGQFNDYSTANKGKRKLPLRQAKVVRMSDIQGRL